MQYAPTWAHLYYPSIQYVYPCRGVLHTAYNHPARDERIDHKSPNDYTASAWLIEGRMQYAPTQTYLYHPSIQYAYPCRGVLHTPHNHSVRDEWIDLKSENGHPFPLETIVGRMQYAPTQAHLYHPSIKYTYPCRSQKHTPHNHPARDECIDPESENVHPFPSEKIEKSMLYANIKRRKM